MLDGNERGAMRGADPVANRDRPILERDELLDLQAVPGPRHARVILVMVEQAPRVVRGAAVEAVVSRRRIARIAGVRQHALPTPAVRTRPPLLVQLAREGGLGA